MKRSKILLVDDDLGTIKLMSHMLTGIAEVQFATGGEDALSLIRDSPPALILLDAQMPGMTGFQVCETLKADVALAQIPVIFVTSRNEPAFEVAGFELGAVDFITKPVSPPLLVARVKTQLRLKQLSDELRHMATIDGLTNVANRRHFDEALNSEWMRLRRSGDPVSLLLIDVDHFKLFNDRYGHPAGDVCLQLVARALTQACLRPADLVARYGGEEFILLLPQTPRAGAEHVAARILVAVESLGLLHDASPTAAHVTISVGVSSYDEDSVAWADSPSDSRFSDALMTRASPDLLLRAADQGLYAAKQSGRAQAWFLDVADADAPGQAREILPLSRMRLLTENS